MNINTFNLKKALSTSAAVIACSTMATTAATTIATYTLAGNLTDSASAPGITASSVVVGAGLIEAYTGSGDTEGLGGNLGAFGFGGSSSLAATITSDNYISFSITPTSTLDLDELSFSLQANSLNGTHQYAIFSDYGATPFTNGNQIATGNIGTAGGTFIETVDLSSLTGITAATEVRIYLYRTGTNTSNSFTKIQDINLTAVPEPSSAALLGLGGLALILRRRK